MNNPFTDRIVLTHATGRESYELHDATGRMIWSGAHIEKQDFSDLLPGTYVLRVFEAGSMRTMKAIKRNG